ncbi:hypothetical protein DTF12_00340 [Salmonella enterica subsp. salamae]|nr:hypothetical protein [Salmonella enterica subsp. salamae]
MSYRRHSGYGVSMSLYILIMLNDKGKFWCWNVWRLLKKARPFMETISPFPGNNSGLAKV